MAPKHPSPEMIKEIQDSFKRHGWSGRPLGISQPRVDESSSQCPPGTSPKQITYQLPDGTWVTKTVCL